MKAEKFTSDSLGKSKTNNHQSINKENDVPYNNQDIFPLNTISSSSSVQIQSKAVTESIASTSAKASTSHEANDAISKNQELSLDKSLINKITELPPGKTEVSNKHQIVSEQVTLPEQNASLQKALNMGEVKRNNNVSTSDNSSSLKSDVNVKSEASLKDASSGYKKNSNKIILNDILDKPTSSEKQDESHVNSGMKTFGEGSKEMSSEALYCSGNENKSDVVSQKIGDYKDETKSKICQISSDTVSNGSKSSEDLSTSHERLIQTSESKSGISSSTAIVSTSPEFKPNLPSSSKGKDIYVEEPKINKSITPTEKITTISESKQDMPTSPVGTISNIPESKRGTSPRTFDENNTRPQPVVSKTKNLNVLDKLQNVPSSEKMVINIATDENVTKKGDVTEILKNEPQEINNSLLENKQLSDIQSTEINNQVISNNITEINNLPAKSLPSTSAITHEKVESEISKPQIESNEKASEVLKDKSKLSTDIENVEQSSTTQHIESIEKENAAEVGKHSEIFIPISDSEQLPGKENVEDSNIIQHHESMSVQPESLTNVINANVEKNNAMISNQEAKDTSVPSKSGDAKAGKIKTSKTGKGKKLSKDNKDLQTKNLVKSDTSPMSAATNASSSTNEKERKVIDSSNTVNLASEKSSITSVSNASSSTNENESESS